MIRSIIFAAAKGLWFSLDRLHHNDEGECREPPNTPHQAAFYLGDGGLECLRVGVERALALPRLLPHTSRQPLASCFREDDSSKTSVFLHPLRHLRRKTQVVIIWSQFVIIWLVWLVVDHRKQKNGVKSGRRREVGITPFRRTFQGLVCAWCAALFLAATVNILVWTVCCHTPPARLYNIAAYAKWQTRLNPLTAAKLISVKFHVDCPPSVSVVLKGITPTAVSAAYSGGGGKATADNLHSSSGITNPRSHTPHPFNARLWAASSRTRSSQAGWAARLFPTSTRHSAKAPRNPRGNARSNGLRLPSFFALAYPHIPWHVVRDDRFDVNDLHRKERPTINNRRTIRK